MFPSHAWVGIGVGAVFALIDWFVLRPLVERPLRAGAEQAAGIERDRAEARIRLMRSFFLWQFVVFPVAGYVIARMVWG